MSQNLQTTEYVAVVPEIIPSRVRFPLSADKKNLFFRSLIATGGHVSKVQVIDGDGETIIAVRRKGLTAKQKTRLALFDNRAAELAEWNPKILAELAPEELEGMFSDKELSEILSQAGVEPKDAEPQIDKAEELRQRWGTETGQLWVIGNHRLLVGDFPHLKIERVDKARAA